MVDALVATVTFFVILLGVLALFALPFYIAEKSEWDERILGWLEKGNPKSITTQHTMIDRTVTHGVVYSTYHWKCTCGHWDNSIYKSLARGDYLKHRMTARRKAKGKGEW